MEMKYFGADPLILHPFLFSVSFVILVSPAVFFSIVTLFFVWNWTHRNEPEMRHENPQIALILIFFVNILVYETYRKYFSSLALQFSHAPI